MKLFSTLVAISLLQVSYTSAQTKQAPNYDSIELQIKDINSSMYYPKLMSRFELGDSTFTQEELQHLYFGYQFQSTYSPYGRGSYNDSISAIFNSQKKELEEIDYRNLIRYAAANIKEDPFQCKNYYYQNFAYRKLNEGAENILQNKHKVKNIIKALESTGTGLTYDDRMYVINVAQEYNYLEHYNFEVKSQRLIQTTDYLELKPNEHDVNGFYFDVSASFMHLNKILGDQDIKMPKNKRQKKNNK